MELILARCGPDPALFGDVQSLSEADQARLLDNVPHTSGSFAEPLSDGRLAIGRRDGVRCTWWLTPTDLLLEPAHALWLEPALFQPDGDGTVPNSLDAVALWNSLPPEWPWASVLAGIVEAVRLRETVCVRAPAEHQLALAVLAAWLLGRTPERADGKREPWSMAVGHRTRSADVAFGPGAATRVIDPGNPPAVGDPVAIHVRDRLASELAAFDVNGGIHRAWVDARSRLGRGEQLAMLLGAQGTLEDLGEGLVLHTISTSDPRPWLALKRRPAVMREAAVTRLLSTASRVRATTELVQAIDGIYPRGAPLAPWCAALLEWLRRAPEPEGLLEVFSNALLDWPRGSAAATRASMWTEAIRVLVSRNRADLARVALHGDVAKRLIFEGSGVAVATMWATLPTEHRTEEELEELIAAFGQAPEGDAAVAQLFRHLTTNVADVKVLFDLWFAYRGAPSCRFADRLRVAVWDTRHRQRWMRHAASYFGDEPVLALIAEASPSDPVWVEFEAATSEDLTLLARFRRLRLLLDGRVALVPVARGLLPDALPQARFPDPELAAVASSFLDVPGASVIWAWLAVASAPPGAYPDAMIDGTVVDLCAHPPGAGERLLALQIVERLALGTHWNPLDHARWMVRFGLAPDGDHTGFQDHMAARLVRALGQRNDGSAHLAAAVGQLLELDPSHPVVQSLFLRWLPSVWTEVPPEFVASVEAIGVPPALQAAWNALAHR